MLDLGDGVSVTVSVDGTHLDDHFGRQYRFDLIDEVTPIEVRIDVDAVNTLANQRRWGSERIRV